MHSSHPDLPKPVAQAETIHPRLRASLPHIGLALLLSLLTLLALGCSDGGSSPSEPPPPAGNAGSAVVQGQVVAVTGGSKSAGGVTVRVEGTSLTTTTNANGNFNLPGVPAGNRVMVFENAEQSGALALNGVQANEQIELSVSLDGNNVELHSMNRRSGDEGEEEELDLSLQMQPDSWDVDWPQSSGSVSARVSGDGFDRIDTDSILLAGTDAGAAPLAPFRVDVEGNHVRAFFHKPDAFALLDDPQPESLHEMVLTFTVDGEPMELTDTIKVEDEDDEEEEEDEASVEIEKSTNGANADKAPGPEIPVGDPVEWTYEVTNDGDTPLTGIVVSDDQGVSVSCPGDSLEAGESMVCSGFGEATEGQYRNVGRVEASGPNGETVSDEDASHYFGLEEDSEEPGEVDLRLEIQPQSWNTNWAGSSGTVSAFIRGEGFDRIDEDSIELIGTDPGAAPLSPTRVSVAGNHVRAFFQQSDALALLDTPEPKEEHEVTVRFTLDDGAETMELTDVIKVVGSGKK